MNLKPLFLIPVNNQTDEQILHEIVKQLEFRGFKVKGKPEGYKKITIKSH